MAEDSVEADMQRGEIALREALAQGTPSDKLTAVLSVMNDWPKDRLDALFLVIAGKLAFRDR